MFRHVADYISSLSNIAAAIASSYMGLGIELLSPDLWAMNAGLVRTLEGAVAFDFGLGEGRLGGEAQLL